MEKLITQGQYDTHIYHVLTQDKHIHMHTEPDICLEGPAYLDIQ